MSQESNWKNMIAKPAIHGGVSAFAIDMLAGENKNFVWSGREIPVWQLGLAMGAATSFSTEFISNIILPHIPQSQKFKHLESMVLHIGLSAGSFALVPKLLNGNLNLSEAKRFALTGALAEAVSSYVYENFLAFESS